MKHESVEEVLRKYIDDITFERNELRAKVICLEATLKKCCTKKKKKK